jgi:hypothetical protein
LANEGFVVKLVRDHHIDQRQGQRAVRAGPHLKQHVRLARDPDPAWIHRDDFHAALPGRNDIMSEN